MISCFTGTPGSGKSLHMAKQIYNDLKHTNRLVIANFPINKEYFTEEELKRFIYLSNAELGFNEKLALDSKLRLRKDYITGPRRLEFISRKYWSTHTAKNHQDMESRIHLFLDEAQMLFNNRSWMMNSRLGWPEFFSVHRHLGFEVTLSTQMISNIDRQVQGIVEYEVLHRKVSNFGLLGKFFSLLFGGNLFISFLIWFPNNQTIDRVFFRYKNKYGKIYDTHAIFGADSEAFSFIKIDGVGREIPLPEKINDDSNIETDNLDAEKDHG